MEGRRVGKGVVCPPTSNFSFKKKRKKMRGGDIVSRADLSCRVGGSLSQNSYEPPQDP